jgi:hypothetical protein
MLRVYCDSNVYRLIKPRHPSFSVDLLRTVSDLKKFLLFVFSDAHLDDLKSGIDKAKIDEDLEIIGEYCKDNYFSYSHVDKEKKLEVFLATPFDAFYSKDFEAEANLFANGFNVDSLFKDLEDDPSSELAKSLVKSYFDLPISIIGPTFDLTSIDDKSKVYFDKILPGYNDNMSIGDFVNSFIPYGTKLLFDIKEFTELRKLSAQYFNSEEYSYKKWGLAFNEKLLESPFGKTFLEMVESSMIDAHKNDPLYKFTYIYSLLETYGVVQERDPKNKLKKFTFDSLHRDASHAYYASHCDYLVTDDKGLQMKAHIMYHLFGIKTQILSTRDFINHRAFLLGNEETVESFYKSVDSCTC